MIAERRKAVSGRLSFEDVAVRAYGRPLASLFLLNYSEKLWGAPCSRLSPLVGGGRLKGLNLRSAIADTLLGRARRAEHVDGSFYYPADGIGAIADALAASCGAESITTNTRVTRVIHDNRRVTHIEVNGEERLTVEQLVCTLPLPVLVRLLDPPLDGLVAPNLRFRTLRLVVLFLNRASVTSSATVYFPDPAVPFTRVYEPRNRSPRMSPAGRTSLVAELPCTDGDPISELDDEAAIAAVTASLEPTGWFGPEDILDAVSVRIPAAYPVIDLEAENEARRTQARLAGLANLTLAGRAGRFEYAWIHNLLQHGRDLVSRIGSPAERRS
jgi:protoporphyrinogen oxidase